jgi:drug/metabolite transporter (DMT)-like permease
MGLLFCGAAVLSFSGLYLAVGRSQKFGVNPTGLNFATFAMGALLSVAAALPVSAAQFPVPLIVVGSLIGVTAGLGLVGTTLAVKAGIGLSVVTTVISLALAVPIVLSLALYGETPAPHKWLGLALALLSIVLIQWRRK